MNKSIIAGLLAGTSLFVATPAAAAPPSGGDYVPIFSDEFNSVPSSCALLTFDCTKWDQT